MGVILKTELSLKEFKRGKVRDIYELTKDQLLIVATDRVSAFDVVMKQGIPGKGRVLSSLSKFWFEKIAKAGIIKTHYLEKETKDYQKILPLSLGERIMVVKKTKVVPVEFVIRGYLAGSEWKLYQQGGGVKKLWPDLKEAQKLPLPICTPTTKAEQGHDQDLREQKEFYQWLEEWFKKEGIFKRIKISPANFAQHLVSKSLAIYQLASNYAESRGIIIADTKFEFGLDQKGDLYLVDEVLTPDSSRFWLKKDYRPGQAQAGYDKQPLRDWLESTGWGKTPPPPDLDPKIIDELSQRYLQIAEILID